MKAFMKGFVIVMAALIVGLLGYRALPSDAPDEQPVVMMEPSYYAMPVIYASAPDVPGLVPWSHERIEVTYPPMPEDIYPMATMPDSWAK